MLFEKSYNNSYNWKFKFDIDFNFDHKMIFFADFV